MPLEAKRCRQRAVAIPIIAVAGFVTFDAGQQCAQPQQPYFTYHETLIAGAAANRSIAASASATSLAALRSSGVPPEHLFTDGGVTELARTGFIE
jgi:hypothetical protein